VLARYLDRQRLSGVGVLFSRWWRQVGVRPRHCQQRTQSQGRAILLFLAFLPQFIDFASAFKTLAFLALGATFITIGTIWCLVLALTPLRARAFPSTMRMCVPDQSRDGRSSYPARRAARMEPLSDSSNGISDLSPIRAFRFLRAAAKAVNSNSSNEP